MIQHNGRISIQIIPYLLHKHILQLIDDFGELQHLTGQLLGIESWKNLTYIRIQFLKNIKVVFGGKQKIIMIIDHYLKKKPVFGIILSVNWVLVRIQTLTGVIFMCLYLVSVQSRSGGCGSPAAMQHSLSNHHKPVSAPPAPPAKYWEKKP